MPNDPSVAPAWHAQSTKTVLESLTTTANGLTKEEASDRLTKHGPNRLSEAKRRSLLLRLLYQFHNTLIYVLMAAGSVTALLGHWVDACVILGVVLLNAMIGVVQEGKAEDALQAIRQMRSPNAMVMRDGRQMTIPAETLVPGDIVLLQSGDKVPADLRLLHAKGLQIQESALTGESMAVESVIGDHRCTAHGTAQRHYPSPACG